MSDNGSADNASADDDAASTITALSTTAVMDATDAAEAAEAGAHDGFDVLEEGAADGCAAAPPASYTESLKGWVWALGAIMQRRASGGDDDDTSGEEESGGSEDGDDASGGEEERKDVALAMTSTPARGGNPPMVVVCSPWRVSAKAGVKAEVRYAQHVLYAQACMQDSMQRHEAPVVPHLQFTTAFNANSRSQRELGRNATNELVRLAKRVVVYTDLGTTPGMAEVKRMARVYGTQIETRRLPSGVGFLQELQSPTEPQMAASHAAHVATQTAASATGAVVAAPDEARLERDVATVDALKAQGVTMPCMIAAMMWSPETRQAFRRFVAALR